MTDPTEPLLHLTPTELRRIVDEAVAEAVQARTAELRAEVASAIEVDQEHIKTRQLSKAANEGLVFHTDPGTGYEYAVISLDLIDYNPLSRRDPTELEPDNPDLQALVDDIKARGGLNRPLLVYRRKGEHEGRYMLVKGSRRLAALRAIGEELNHAYILPAKPPIDMEEQWVNGY